MEAAVDPAAASSDLPLFPQEEWYEQLLRYGLYLGAAFQLICILALIFDVSPQNDLEDNSESEDESDEEEDVTIRHRQHQQRRQERKKRR